MRHFIRVSAADCRFEDDEGTTFPEPCGAGKAVLHTRPAGLAGAAEPLMRSSTFVNWRHPPNAW
jgi:hypothetical protein